MGVCEKVDELTYQQNRASTDADRLENNIDFARQLARQYVLSRLYSDYKKYGNKDLALPPIGHFDTFAIRYMRDVVPQKIADNEVRISYIQNQEAVRQAFFAAAKGHNL